LDVFYGGLRIRQIAIIFFIKKKKKTSAVFFQLPVIKTQDQDPEHDPDPDSLEMLRFGNEDKRRVLFK
jgi:hypothetical protein